MAAHGSHHDDELNAPIADGAAYLKHVDDRRAPCAGHSQPQHQLGQPAAGPQQQTTSTTFEGINENLEPSASASTPPPPPVAGQAALSVQHSSEYTSGTYPISAVTDGSPGSTTDPRASRTRLVTTMVQQGDQCRVRPTMATASRRSAATLAARIRRMQLSSDDQHMVDEIISTFDVDYQLGLDSSRPSSPRPPQHLTLAQAAEPAGISKAGSLRFRSSSEAGMSCHAMKKSEPRMRRRPKRTPNCSRPSSGHGESPCPTDPVSASS